MKYQGLALSGDERRAIAEWLTGRKLRAPLTVNTIGNCGPPTRLRAGSRISTSGPPSGGPTWSWNGWGPGLDNTHFQPAEQGCRRVEGRGRRSDDGLAGVEREILDANLDHRP